MTEIKLPSGAMLMINPAPFADAKALYQAMLKEVKQISFDPKTDIDTEFIKNVFCTGFSSEIIEAKVWECMKRCTYNKEKLVPDIFEPVEARDDYFTVCFEVAKENIAPFTKSLYAQYSHILDLLKVKDPA